VRIELFGGLQVVSDDFVATQFETRQTASLLAYLALYSSRCHSRDELAEHIWPGDDPEANRGRLRQALAARRRGLGEA
jgi:DNA-binding SARP family transcriptional activator